MTASPAPADGPPRRMERDPRWPTIEEHDKPLRSDSVTADAAARLPRQSGIQTRSDLLEAAIRIVNAYVAEGPREGDPPVDLLPFVRLDEVLDGASELARQRLVEEGGLRPQERVAPLTAGAFYKAFASDYQEGGKGAVLTAFRRVVMRQMVEDPVLTTADVYIRLGKEMAEDGQPWTEVTRLGIEREFLRWASTPALILMYALALHARDDDVSDWTREAEKRHLGELARVYGELLPAFGRRMRPGLTVENMAIVVSDLIAGMAVGSRLAADLRQLSVLFDVDNSGRQEEWTLCALGAWAIYNSFTERIDERRAP